MKDIKLPQGYKPLLSSYETQRAIDLGNRLFADKLAGALRLWRLALAVLGGLCGLFGLAAGAVLLIGHLAGLDSFGSPYLIPFAAGDGEQIFRQPLPHDKFRPVHLKGRNRRKQK